MKEFTIRTVFTIPRGKEPTNLFLLLWWYRYPSIIIHTRQVSLYRYTGTGTHTHTHIHTHTHTHTDGLCRTSNGGALWTVQLCCVSCHLYATQTHTQSNVSPKTFQHQNSNHPLDEKSGPSPTHSHQSDKAYLHHTDNTSVSP